VSHFIGTATVIIIRSPSFHPQFNKIVATMFLLTGLALRMVNTPVIVVGLSFDFSDIDINNNNINRDE